MPAPMPPEPALPPMRCPRCRGRVHHEQDHYGNYLNCLMCGYTRDLTSAAVIQLDNVRDADTDNADTPAVPSRPLR